MPVEKAKPEQKTKAQTSTKPPARPTKKTAPPKKSGVSSSKPSVKVSPSDLETGRKLVKQFISGKYWDLYLDIYLMFSLSVGYGIILYFTLDFLGEIFLVFAIICCILISAIHYTNMKQDIDMALKDLELILK
ncbi:hypothetical protein [[Eubacterium] cellulosolvens]